MEARRGETGRCLARLDAKHESPARSRQAQGHAQALSFNTEPMSEQLAAILISLPTKPTQPNRLAIAQLS